MGSTQSKKSDMIKQATDRIELDNSARSMKR